MGIYCWRNNVGNFDDGPAVGCNDNEDVGAFVGFLVVIVVGLEEDVLMMKRTAACWSHKDPSQKETTTNLYTPQQTFYLHDEIKDYQAMLKLLAKSRKENTSPPSSVPVPIINSPSLKPPQSSLVPDPAPPFDLDSAVWEQMRADNASGKVDLGNMTTSEYCEYQAKVKRKIKQKQKRKSKSQQK